MKYFFILLLVSLFSCRDFISEKNENPKINLFTCDETGFNNLLTQQLPGTVIRQLNWLWVKKGNIDFSGAWDFKLGFQNLFPENSIIFGLASISKFFTSARTLEILNQYFPKHSGKYLLKIPIDKKNKRQTEYAANFLGRGPTHTSGLPGNKTLLEKNLIHAIRNDNLSPETMKVQIKQLLKKFPEIDPGEFEYSDLGFELIPELLENLLEIKYFSKEIFNSGVLLANDKFGFLPDLKKLFKSGSFATGYKNGQIFFDYNKRSIKYQSIHYASGIFSDVYSLSEKTKKALTIYQLFFSNNPEFFGNYKPIHEIEFSKDPGEAQKYVRGYGLGFDIWARNNIANKYSIINLPKSGSGKKMKVMPMENIDNLLAGHHGELNGFESFLIFKMKHLLPDSGPPAFLIFLGAGVPIPDKMTNLLKGHFQQCADG